MPNLRDNAAADQNIAARNFGPLRVHRHNDVGILDQDLVHLPSLLA